MSKEKTFPPLTRLCIAHLNDTHSHFEPSPLPLLVQTPQGPREAYASVGGFARIATRVDHWRERAAKEQRDFMLLHAGDTFQGSLYFSLYKGQANVEMLNQLGIDAMALGNHELDMGNESFSDFCRQMQFPLLAGNWNLESEDPDKSFRFSEQPHVHSFCSQGRHARWIVKACHSANVALFGLSIDKMPEISAPDADTPFESAFEVARNTVEAIKRSGINQIIVLSHLGYDGDKLLAQRVPGIALIVGGHSHVLQGDFEDIGQAFFDPYGLEVNGTRIVQAGCHAMALGHLNIDLDAKGRVVGFEGCNELLIGRTLFKDAKQTQGLTESEERPFAELIAQKTEFVQCEQQEEVKSLLERRFKPQVDALASQSLALLSRKLRHQRIPHELSDPNTGSQVAPLVAKSFWFAMQQQQIKVAGMTPQFAIHNAGGVRASMYAGTVTKADVAGKVLPFTVNVGCYAIKGKDIRGVLQGAVDNALSPKGTGTGSFPYCYGLRFELAEHDEALCVDGLMVFIDGAWQVVEDETIYCGCSSAYTMTGREGYSSILNIQADSVVSDLSMADCFIAYLEALAKEKSVAKGVNHLLGNVL